MVVQCTWKPAEERNISDAVSWTSVEDAQANDVEEEVQAENCLLLVAPYDGASEYLAAPACQLIISCQATQQIQYIAILCDARMMEIYGHHGEYLKTIRNELLEEIEDMAVFKGDIKLERPLNVCSIKFAGLRSKNEMWLYGVKVGLDKAPNQGNGPQVPFAEVEQRLAGMGLSLSENAQAFKELVEARHPNFSGLSGQDISALINLFKMSAINKDLPTTNGIENNTAEHSPTPTNANNDTVNENSGKVENIENNNTVVLCNSETQTMDPPPPNFEDVIKPFIEQKFEEIEKQLWEKVQKGFQEIEAKVLCKLDEIESFVKPQGV